MAGTRSRKKLKIIESDDDNDDIRDQDWTPGDDEISLLQSFTGDNDTSLPEDTEFDSTEGFQLKTVKRM